jgi:hypothetical protein
VASVPFLWVLPLVVYLFSFVLSFENDRWYRRALFLPAAALLLALAAYGLQSGLGQRLQTALPLYVGGLFCWCVVLHGEMARRRPAARYLTRFYLMLSLGGALGGIAVGLVAPVVLPAYYELGLGLVMLALLGMLMWRRQRAALAVCGLLVLVCGSFLVMQVRDDSAGTRVMSRNFYGTLSINDAERDDPADNVRQMYHGAVKHGEQYAVAARRREPTTYYGPTSGIGRAIESAPTGPAHWRPTPGPATATACTRSTPTCSRWPTGSSASWPTAPRRSSASWATPGWHWSASRRRASMCWRSTPSRATRCRCTC